MTKVFYASTLFGAMTLAAASDAGYFGDRGERRVLIASTNTSVPEAGRGFVASDAFAPLRERFDEIASWNELIAPLHPSGWTPAAAETPMLARLVRQSLGLTDVSELVLESPAVAPAATIGALIEDCPVTVYADGLMSYGPTRNTLSERIGRRARRLLHLDLVPGLRPMLLSEMEVEVEAIPDDAFEKVVAELPAPDVAGWHGAPVILGQYLSAIEVMTPDAEHRLHADMLRGLHAAGHRRVVFRPHPAAGAVHARALHAVAVELGVTLAVPGDGLPAEAWFAAAAPELVVGCFSTALCTAGRFAGVPAATVGAGVVLDALTPYENSNRIPATIIDASLPRLGVNGELVAAPPRPLTELVSAVGYCMQADRNPQLRTAAEGYLATYGSARYFKNKRLQALRLAPDPRPAVVRRTRATGRRVAQRTREALPRSLQLAVDDVVRRRR